MIEPIIDVSKWQGDINADTMIKAGAKALYIKAGGTDKTNGASYHDWRFRENAQKFSERIPCGYYYFFYPHFDGAKQANYFCDLLSSVKWNLPPAIDVEDNPQKVSQANFQKEIKKFLDVVENRLNTKGVIYTRAFFWNANVGNPSWAKNYKLWIALYSETMDHPWENNPNSSLRPKPWTDYWLWQYSADSPPNNRGPEFGAIGSTSIDISRCNMSPKDFYAFAKWDPDMVPVDIPETEEGEETGEEPEKEVHGTTIKYPHKAFLRAGFTALRLRSTPTTLKDDNTVGIIAPGYTFTVHEEYQIGDDLWWLVELPDHLVGWGARRVQGITYLEYAN